MNIGNLAKIIEYIKETFEKIVDSIKDFFKDLFDGSDKEKVDAGWFLAAKSNNGNDKDNNGNNGNSSDNGNNGNNDSGNNKNKDKNGNNGNNKNKNKNNGKHKGWYKRADHPKNPGDLDPLDDIGTYEIINYVNDVSLENAQVLMTSDENGNYTNAYTYGLDRISVDNLLVENEVKTDPRYYLYDGRGSVSDVINTFGQAKDKYSYDPYGEFSHGGYLGSSETHYENFYGYNGEDYNRLSGLEYLRARYYEPETGRFLTRDSYLGSIMEPLTLNRYAYAVNNPVMNIDPSGHWPKWLSSVTKKVTSAVSSAWNSTKNFVSKAASTVGNAISNAVKEVKSWVAPINENKNNVKTTAETNVYNFKGSLRNTSQNIQQQSKPAITTRNYPIEVVRANIESVKNSCEGAQNVKSQEYEYEEKVTQIKGSLTLGELKNNPGGWKFDNNAEGWYLAQQYYLTWYYGTKAYERLDEGSLSHNSYLVFKLNSMLKNGEDLSKQTVDDLDEMSFNMASTWHKIDTAALAVYGAYTGYQYEKAAAATKGAGNTGKWIDEAGNIKWPPNNGAVPGTEKVVNLKKGTTFGRIGSNKGSYVAPPGTSPDKLALAPNTDLTNYTEYQVIKNIPGVEKATVAPWFDKPGGGIQFKLPMSVEELLKGGYIKKVVN